MALSTRAKLAGLGGALALGVLGATGVAYAADGTGASPQYVTTVDDGTTGYGTQPAPAEGSRPDGGREDCPDRSGGSGTGGTSPAPSPGGSGSTSGAADT